MVGSDAVSTVSAVYKLINGASSGAEDGFKASDGGFDYASLATMASSAFIISGKGASQFAKNMEVGRSFDQAGRGYESYLNAEHAAFKAGKNPFVEKGYQTTLRDTFGLSKLSPVWILETGQFVLAILDFINGFQSPTGGTKFMTGCTAFTTAQQDLAAAASMVNWSGDAATAYQAVNDALQDQITNMAQQDAAAATALDDYAPKVEMAHATCTTMQAFLLGMTPFVYYILASYAACGEPEIGYAVSENFQVGCVSFAFAAVAAMEGYLMDCSHELAESLSKCQHAYDHIASSIASLNLTAFDTDAQTEINNVDASNAPPPGENGNGQSGAPQVSAVTGGVTGFTDMSSGTPTLSSLVSQGASEEQRGFYNAVVDDGAKSATSPAKTLAAQQPDSSGTAASTTPAASAAAQTAAPSGPSATLPAKSGQSSDRKGERVAAIAAEPSSVARDNGTAEHDSVGTQAGSDSTETGRAPVEVPGSDPADAHTSIPTALA